MKRNLRENSNFMLVKNFPCLDARLPNICISTSAAPTYLPAYQFKNQDNEGNVRKFNLIDGGVAANNPVYNHLERVNFKLHIWCSTFDIYLLNWIREIEYTLIMWSLWYGMNYILPYCIFHKPNDDNFFFFLKYWK